MILAEMRLSRQGDPVEILRRLVASAPAVSPHEPCDMTGVYAIIGRYSRSQIAREVPLPYPVDIRLRQLAGLRTHSTLFSRFRKILFVCSGTEMVGVDARRIVATVEKF